ncbi:5-oxoprolinase subunit PxpB [Botryobacter ruber]|uniref:5-oxoprolinase subunit PxpB n=1 Tax=Botryobacter ruber TaxID=2171629 RepID=UPI000E0C2CDF|nr:5-oxoprolinase subunit PxpB [Botryobacter ruber]
MRPFQLYPLGDTAIVLQFGEEIDDNIFPRIRAIAAYLDQHPFPGMMEYVPAYTTITIYYDPWVISEKGKYDPYAMAVAHMQELLPQAAQEKKQKARTIKIPVCYGGEYGPDLEFVADHNKLSPKQVIRLHSGADYIVHMIGFAPGFPYLGGLHKKLATPRKDMPQALIPAGSVGIAGNQTGIYPIETPGGWQLIGRTPLELFNPNRETPSLLRAGDIVRFEPISEKQFNALKEKQHES